MAEGSATGSNTNDQEFSYLPPPSSHPDINFAMMYREETFQEKLYRKTGENPFIPIGLAVTTYALVSGLWTLRTGDRVKSQKMMRLRVVAQGFTVFALLAGVLYSATKKKSKQQ